MPYIKRKKRELYEHDIQGLVDKIQSTAGMDEIDGDLNYIISVLLARTLLRTRGGQSRRRYVWMQKAMGILACVGHEFYSRVMSPYESMCIQRKGDIPEYEGALDPDPVKTSGVYDESDQKLPAETVGKKEN